MNNAMNAARSIESGTERPMPRPIDGEPLSIGGGFSARSFRAMEVGASMDPLVMVDHYVMTEPTFGTHPHAGMSAVSLLFLDSEGRFHNRDSLGNDFDLLPGDLYWLRAGRGAIHNESPRAGSRTHGLQVFVNLPQERRYEQPSSLLVRREDMPSLVGEGYRVRIALGASNGVAGAQSPALPMTILDGELAANGSFEHQLEPGRNAWVHAIDGEVEVTVSGRRTGLKKGQAFAVENTDGAAPLVLRVSAANGFDAHFALLDGQAVQEPFVQQGPFVMGAAEEIDAAQNDFEAGRFGAID